MPKMIKNGRMMKIDIRDVLKEKGLENSREFSEFYKVIEINLDDPTEILLEQLDRITILENRIMDEIIKNNKK